MKVLAIIFLLLSADVFSQNYCLRFRGNGVGDIDRVKIPIDNPHNKLDVGQSFTIEFQMRATLADNPLGAGATSGNNDDWTLGHVIIDRDIFGNGDYGDYGISLANGRIAFGVNNGSQSYTIISNTTVANDQWHHVAVTRNHINGQLAIFIDGLLDVSYVSGVTGNISYRDNRTTSWPNDPYLVIGAEKHDYDNTTYPSFRGLLDELRVSNVVRYTSNYTPVNTFTDDSSTVLLYHFNEGTGSVVNDSAILFNGTLLHGTINFGGNPVGPQWVLRDNTLEIDEHDLAQNKHFKIYPNPVLQDLYINAEIDADCAILDVSGRVISKWRVYPGNNRQSLSHLKPGSYLLSIQPKTGNESRTLVNILIKSP